MSKVLEVIKAMDETNAGEGLEFKPTELSAQLQEKLRLDRKVEALFTPVNMPTNPYKFPVEGADATGYLVAENTGDTGQTAATASTPGTADVTLTAKKLKARVLVSEELEQDSIIPIAGYIKDKVSKALTDAVEDAILNGDTTGTHMDSDVTAATDRRKAWKGLRKYALAVTELKKDLSTFSTSNLRALRAQMGSYGVDPGKLAWICGPSVYQSLINLTEVTTVDKYGAQATLLSGELAKLDGIPVIVSELMRENLNASGVYDGTTTTKKTILLVYRPEFLIGTRAGVTIKSDENIDYGQTTIVCGVRKDFEPLATPSASRQTVVIGYNIA